MPDPFDAAIYGTPAEIPEIVRRLAAYAYVTCEDYDRHLNAVYGYTPRRDEIHPDARSASTIHAGAVWRAVASVAGAYGVPLPEVRHARARIRDYDDATHHYAPAGGRRLPDRLDMELRRAVDAHVRAAFERRFDP